MTNWIGSYTPTQKESINKAMEIIMLEKVAFGLQNNETEYNETRTQVENI